MSDFDDRLQSALSKEDEAFLQETLTEKGYYRELFDNLKGPGTGLNKAGWVAVIVLSAFLFFCLFKAFHADTTRAQILFASLAVMANSGQIAFKMWLNMRMNRRAILMEVQKLKLMLTHQTN